MVLLPTNSLLHPKKGKIKIKINFGHQNWSWFGMDRLQPIHLHRPCIATTRHSLSPYACGTSHSLLYRSTITSSRALDAPERPLYDMHPHFPRPNSTTTHAVHLCQAKLPSVTNRFYAAPLRQNRPQRKTTITRRMPSRSPSYHSATQTALYRHLLLQAASI